MASNPKAWHFWMGKTQFRVEETPYAVTTISPYDLYKPGFKDIPVVCTPDVFELTKKDWTVLLASKIPTEGFIPGSFHQVYQDGTTRLKVARTLTARVRSSLTEKEQVRLVDPYGLVIVERLRFCPGLFVATPFKQGVNNILEAVDALTQHDEVEWVEPVWEHRSWIPRGDES